MINMVLRVLRLMVRRGIWRQSPGDPLAPMTTPTSELLTLTIVFLRGAEVVVKAEAQTEAVA